LLNEGGLQTISLILKYEYDEDDDSSNNDNQSGNSDSSDNSFNNRNRTAFLILVYGIPSFLGFILIVMATIFGFCIK
jgi:hypothetical protein